MKKQLKSALIVLILGFALTLLSAVVNQKMAFKPCGGSLSQVKKGFPLSYILVKPSESLCNSVEPISILWQGNAFHEEYPVNFLGDFIFWSALSTAVVTLSKHRQATKL